MTCCQHSDRLRRGIMRSFTSCQATDMDWLVWLSLLLTQLPATVPESCISQPNMTIWGTTGQTAVIECTISNGCLAKDFRYEWFAFKQSGHFRLDLAGDKYKLEGASLHIKSLQSNDSGIYHCAVSSSCCRKNDVGMGTSLVVRVTYKTLMGHILVSLFVILAVYSLVLLTLIVRKCGCKTSISRRTCKTDKNNSSRKLQFRDVLQEMYSRRNLEKSKPAEAASSELDSSTDGIYQNV